MSGKDGFARAPGGNMGSQLMIKIPDDVQPCRSLPLVGDSFRKRPAQTIGRNNLHPKPRFVEKANTRLSFNWWLPEHALIPVRYKRGWVLVGSDFAYLQRCGFSRHGSDQHMKIQDVFGAGPTESRASSKRNPGSKLLRWTTFFCEHDFCLGETYRKTRAWIKDPHFWGLMLQALRHYCQTIVRRHRGLNHYCKLWSQTLF